MPTEPLTLTARRWQWHLRGSRRGTGCVALDLVALSRGAPSLSTLIAPFDRVTPLTRAPRWRRGGRRLLARVAPLLSSVGPGQPLACLPALETEPWPHQLEPVLALVEGRGVRLLVADPVGLGKTLTAAIVLAELAARGVGARVLVLTPASLRDQWRDELGRHAGIDAEVVDWIALLRRSRQVFAGASPWSRPGCSILSLDFAKQPGVLAGLAQSHWDALVVDEAHQAAGESARAAAVLRLGSLSRVVLLLTATPHGGDRRAFHALRSTGATGRDPLLWFCHDRAVARPGGTRRTTTWHLRDTPPEQALHQSLRAYATRVERTGPAEGRLAMIVLKKRALSSAAALGRSLDHRRRLLGDEPGAQLLLPLEGPPGEADAADRDQPLLLASPGLEDRGSELAELDRLAALAAGAAEASSKWRAIDRLLRLTSEPVLVFTEYRDTLAALAHHLGHDTQVTVLHGGLTRAERTDAVERFTKGVARVLVATDAAAEGLNLQARCRLVVNVELPWTPVRLEQRVGRLDRMGQQSVVHEWRLAGRAGHEEAVVAALARRAAAIRADLGDVAPDFDLPVTPTDVRATDAEPRRTPGIDSPDLGPKAARAASVARALGRLRRSLRGDAAARTGRASPWSPWYVRLRRTVEAGRGVILVFRSAPRAAGDAVAHVAVHVAMSRLPADSPARWLPAVADAARSVARDALPRPDGLTAALLSRERDLRAALAEGRGGRRARWQPSLFDRRAERAVAASRTSAEGMAVSGDERIADLAAAEGGDRMLEPVLAFLVR